MATMNLEDKAAHLRALISDYGSVAVAFSAGTDSTYLLAVCCDVLGTANVLAVTAESATLPQEELDEAHALAAQLGVRLEVVKTGELDNPDYRRNDPQRCFHCQSERFHTIRAVAHFYELATVAYGLTLDDLSDYRPGTAAAQQYGVQMPLLEAGLRKADIRRLSQQRGLPTHDKPAMACLASRIPYGHPIDVENLAQVAQAEAFLRRDVGLRQVRVRHHGQIARLEVESDDLARVAAPGMRERIVETLHALGFLYVTLDLAGFRSGSMNEGLKLL